MSSFGLNLLVKKNITEKREAQHLNMSIKKLILFCQERSGANTTDVYKPKVFWFELMNSIIRPFHSFCKNRTEY